MTTTHKPAAEVEVGDVLVYRPDPSALTIAYLPTVYRKVEAIDSTASKWGSGRLLHFFFRPPRSMGHEHSHDSAEIVEVSLDVDRSCSITPVGLVLA